MFGHKCNNHTANKIYAKYGHRLRHLFRKYIVKHKYGCWGWKGKVKKGYASIWMLSASQVSWLMHYGPIPLGKYVLHKCDNGVCSKPKHLWAGSIKDNNADRAKKGRNNNPAQKLSIKQVKRIKASLGKSYYGIVADLARKYNVSWRAVDNIKRGLSYRYI